MAARDPNAPLESTYELLQRAKAGDAKALDRLCRRYLPLLRRWASGRLPRRARDLLETDDIVQETLLQTVRQLDRFEHRREGALQTYLRRALKNRLHDELRRVHRQPAAVALGEHQPATDASPLEEAVGRETLARYEQAMDRLPDADREAIVARLELGLGYRRVAEVLGKPSEDAARMAVSRALLRLTEEMSRGPR